MEVSMKRKSNILTLCIASILSIQIMAMDKKEQPVQESSAEPGPYTASFPHVFIDPLSAKKFVQVGIDPSTLSPIFEEEKQSNHVSHPFGWRASEQERKEYALWKFLKASL